jgi:hypothetical protein
MLFVVNVLEIRSALLIFGIPDRTNQARRLQCVCLAQAGFLAAPHPCAEGLPPLLVDFVDIVHHQRSALLTLIFDWT